LKRIGDVPDPDKKLSKIEKLQFKLDEAEKRNDLFTNCLRRALKLWQNKHPEADYWPDGAVNLAWVLDKYTESHEEIKAIQHGFEIMGRDMFRLRGENKMLVKKWDDCIEVIREWPKVSGNSLSERAIYLYKDWCNYCDVKSSISGGK